MSDIGLVDIFGPLHSVATDAPAGGPARPKGRIAKRRGDKPGEIVLPALRPNLGIGAAYRAALTKAIERMRESVEREIAAAYRKNPPEQALAADELSANALRDAIRRLAKRWNAQFDDMAEKLADWFLTKASKRSDAVLRKILRDGGFSVEFKMTRAMRDVFNAAVAENVSLIKSIPQQYLTQVEGHVMRAVAAGGDLKTLSTALQREFGVTRRRAALISRDQTNKTFAMLNRARQTELGVVEAVWGHSGGGNEPRPAHVAAARRGQRYDVAKGWFDEHAYRRKGGVWEGAFIWPGTLINCRCVSRSILPVFKAEEAA